ncbi:MAG: membrane protein [Peptococcaceae bacterium BRH_c4b]|nr:MAG: membrane protein [Peptococcaceae bacterium BRH_c4b]
MRERTTHTGMLFLVLSVLLWSGINPHDRFTWILEVLPALLGILILVFTYRRFKFTTLCYALMATHMIILMVGGHYTYAQVPLFNWIKEILDLSRNHYDRVGHFAQGFIPAIVAREILLRTSPLKRGKLLSVIIISICLAISAFYELIEWWVAMATGTAAEAFLGTQGDIWDTQWDMFLALCGAVTSLLLLSWLHNRSLKKLNCPQ